MIYKKIGKAGGYDYDNSDTYTYGIPLFKIIIDERIVKLPQPIYLFWQEMTDEVDDDISRQAFVETGIDVSIFDEYIKILLSENVIIAEY